MSEDLPVGWASAKLSEVVEPGALIQYGILQPGPDLAGGVPYVRPTEIVNDKIDVGAVRRTAPEIATKYHRSALKAGDVILSIVGSIGKVATVPASLDGANITQSSARLRPQTGLIESPFLANLLRSPHARKLYEEAELGTGVPRLNIGDIREMVVPLAPLAEQRRIVTQVEALLEQVNRAKGRLNRVSQILKRFRQAVLAAAFSGELTKEWRDDHPKCVAVHLPEPSPEARRGRRGANLSGDGALLVDDELPELPDTWSYARADRLTASGTVITYGIVLPGPEVEGGVAYVRGQDVEDGRLRTDALRHTTREIVAKHERSALRAGDILLCIIRNLRVCVVPAGLDGANITQGLVRIRTSPEAVVRDFLALYLMSPLAQGWMKRRYFGMDMPRINVEDARAIPVALPPLEEQAEIARQVGRLFALADAIERRVEAATARAEKLPQAILSKAFSGELVPTEAELARAERRTYETAEDLLKRVRTDGTPVGTKPSRGRKRSG